MSNNLIKAELALLGKKQVDLLYEIQKRGYKGLHQSQLSAYMSGTVCGAQSEAVLKLAHLIIDEWKSRTTSERRQAQ